MLQAKFSLTPSNVEFLEQHQRLGFKDKSDMVRAALQRFQIETERKILEESADLYARLYEQDAESKQWVEDALQDWPE